MTVPDTNPSESMDAEGLPSLEDRPPGIDVDLEQDGLVVPRDHPIVVGDDPAYPVTPAEQRQTETVAERAARELPDVGADELNVGGGARHGDQVRPTPLGGTDDEALGGLTADPSAVAEGVDADAPLGTDLADDDLVATTATDGTAGRFYEPDSGDGVDFDDEPAAVAYSAEATDDGLSAEEAAVHLTDDLPGGSTR
ncbi:MAG TPA: hypothetical protein VFP61_00675 [Acidimicrobiales bacterium]|nr:hypothetical protein [Acidimicrobiales bacterium]